MWEAQNVLLDVAREIEQARDLGHLDAGVRFSAASYGGLVDDARPQLWRERMM